MIRRSTQDLLLGLLFTGLSVAVLRGLMTRSARPVAASDAADQPYPAIALRANKVASYQIDAKFDAERHRIQGRETIRFVNASRSPVNELWFHLYLNAFKNDKTLFLRSPFGAGRSGGKALEYGYVDVKKLSVVGGDGDDLWAKRDRHSPDDPDDETDIRVPLASPIEPGRALDFELEFEDQMPEIVERTGYAGSFHFFGQWFPKLARLEPNGQFTHFAFHAQSEFYSDFGDYDVRLDVPSSYRVGATGLLLNQSESEGRRKLEYHAESVHDFAWTAWDRFESRSERIAGTDVTVLYPPHQERNAAIELASVRFALPHFNRQYGAYPYPTLTVVHPPESAGNAGGMEYPQLITTGGPWYSAIGGARGIEVVTTHELGHQWFYGLLASDEHAAPFLDEGFNSYAEAESLEAQFGTGSVFDGFGLSASSTALNRVFSAARGGDEEVAQGAADFATFRSMGALVYSRTAVALATIERVYGRARFRRALGLYTRNYRFEHPTWQDFVSSTLGELDAQAVTALTAVFFQRGTVDYLVRDISNAPITLAAGVFDGPSGRETKKPGAASAASQYASRAVVFRHGSLHFPVDIALTFEDGTKQMRHWDGRSDTYAVDSSGPSRLVSVYVDPDERILLDDDRSNNWFSTQSASAPRCFDQLLFAAQTAFGAFAP
ncbi:MAG: M1 family metallopeptidase [Polyangiaceae bacterium]